ncbi:MAG: energy-coupling factor ABC transporter ATP-binding protein [Bacteroidaceae bacterium]|nr:energy-coupling factor ABC transporter ATP-binding protein [Bacteroidaceae bacterium]
MNILEVNDLSFSYEANAAKQAHEVLQKISFSIAEKQSVGLIGANGAGKSTLLKLICGLLDIQQGSISVVGMQVKKNTLNAIRKEVGYVFQDSDSQLFMSTVYEDVAFAPRNYRMNAQQVDEVVMQALRMVHLDNLKDRHIYSLSGGEKKLASIATVLATESKLMLMDEPTVALDPRNRRNLIQVVNQLPMAKLIASHDLDFIYDTCQQVILLSEGKIINMDATEKLLTNRSLLETHGLELPLSFSRV